MRALSMKVPEALDRDLAKLAKRRGVSKAALVRTAVEEYVARERDGTAAKSLVAAADAPAEPSTSPSGIDDYGW